MLKSRMCFMFGSSDDKKVDEFVHRRRVEPFLVGAQGEDSAPAASAESAARDWSGTCSTSSGMPSFGGGDGRSDIRLRPRRPGAVLERRASRWRSSACPDRDSRACTFVLDADHLVAQARRCADRRRRRPRNRRPSGRPKSSGIATMYWMQWSRSAGLSSGPFLSMMRIADFVGGDHDLLDLRRCDPARAGAASSPHSTAVCAWNSAGNEILNSTFSIT